MHDEALIPAGASDTGRQGEQCRALREVDGMLIDGECRLRKTALHILIIAIRTLEIIVGSTPIRRFIEGKDPVLSHMSLRINIDPEFSET